MPFLSRLGLRRSAPAPTPNQSIERLHSTVETIEKRESHLQKKMDTELMKAKEAQKRGNKTQALAHLKRKRLYEEQVTKLGSQKVNIECMQGKLEDAAMNIEVLNAQRGGAAAISQMYGKLTPEKIDTTMESVREQVDRANEFSEAVSQPLDGDFVDDSELLDELEQMEADEAMMNPNVVAAPPLKEVRKSNIMVEPEEDEEAMLAQLSAQLA